MDRAALDVALKFNIPCGGWCPDGRVDERGTIPEHYPVKELPGAGFAERTQANVKASKGTVVFYSTALAGGSEYTAYCCRECNKPHELVNASKLSPKEAAKAISVFVAQNKIDILNGAGPRASEWPNGYGFAYRALEMAFKAM